MRDLYAQLLTSCYEKEVEAMTNVLPVNSVKEKYNEWEEQGIAKNWLKSPGFCLFPSPLHLGGSIERESSCVMAFLPVTVCC